MKTTPKTPPKVAKQLADRTPTSRRTVVLYQPVPPPVAAYMDVDRAGAILSGTDHGDSRDYFSLCEDIILSDSHLQAEFTKRKLAVLGDPVNVAPANPKSADDQLAAAVVRDQIDGLPCWMDACSALLDSTLLPVAVAEKLYTQSSRRGLAYDVADIVRVTPRLFSFATNRLRLHDLSPEGFIGGTTQAVDPMRYIIHRGHLLTSADQRGGPMRSLIFWWLFKVMDRDWWARFLDRYGSPFLVGKFDTADDYSRIVLQNAFQVAAKIGGIVVSRETQVEIQEAGSKAGGEAFALFHRVCCDEQSKLIVGQVTSSSAHTTGLNSDIGKSQEHVRNDIRQFDSLRLGNTLVQQLWHPFLRLNGLRGKIVLRWGAEESEDLQETTTSVKSLSDAGLELTDEGISSLSERMGLPFRRKAAPAMQLGDLPPKPGESATKPGEPPPGSPNPRPNRLLSLQAPPAADLADEIDAANALIARGGAADVARELGGTAADLRRLVNVSESAADLELRLRLYFADRPVGRLATHLEHNLTAFAAQGAGNGAG